MNNGIYIKENIISFGNDNDQKPEPKEQQNETKMTLAMNHTDTNSH